MKELNNLANFVWDNQKRIKNKLSEKEELKFKNLVKIAMIERIYKEIINGNIFPQFNNAKNLLILTNHIKKLKEEIAT